MGEMAGGPGAMSGATGAGPAAGGRVRTEVLRVAVELFVKRGVKQVSVQDLLDAAGVARRTFYRYFRSKEDVLRALYEQATHELLASLAAPAAPSADPAAGALALVQRSLDAYLQYHVSHFKLTRLLVGEAARAGSALAPLRDRFRAELCAALSAAFVATTGRKLDRFVFLALVSGLEGLSLELLRDEPRAPDVERVRATVMALLEATLAHAGRMPPAGAPRRRT
jgi:AcrR family transcriptional regulator